MRLFRVPLFVALLLAGVSSFPRVTSALPQASAHNEATGRIVGKIKGHVSAVQISLSAPGEPVRLTSADFLEPGHHGEFAFDSLRPGMYHLDIHGFPFPGPGCGVLPWSQTVTVKSGKTTRVTAKVKVARNAICE